MLKKSILFHNNHIRQAQKRWLNPWNYKVPYTTAAGGQGKGAFAAKGFSTHLN